MGALLTGQVVKVVDPFTLVINLGSQHGLAEGAKVLVFTYGEEVLDPETQEPLGKLEIVRGRGTIVHVQERMSTVVSATLRQEQRQRWVPEFKPHVPVWQTEVKPVIDIVDVPVPFDNPHVKDIVRVL